jgi:hypothetical protein
VRVLERIGLTLVWRGTGVPHTEAGRDSSERADTTALERLIFADRPLAPELLDAIIRLG